VACIAVVLGRAGREIGRQLEASLLQMLLLFAEVKIHAAEPPCCDKTNASLRGLRRAGLHQRQLGGPHTWDRTSMDRILFAIFNHENQNHGVSIPLLLTQTF
jgi:hypothetical protein